MIDVFQQAANVLTGDPNLFLDGTFTAAASPGQATAVRVSLRPSDTEFALAGQPLRSAGWTLSLRADQVARRPQKDDLVTVGTRRFRIGTAQLDAAATFYECDATEES